jgi:putative membrane protein
MTRVATYLGFALLGLLWLVPLERLTGAAFPVHMLRHMGLVAVVAPLLAFGLGDRLRWLMISPLIATVLEFMVVWAWHLPQLHGMAYLLPAGFALEQGSFLLVGLLAGAGSLLLTSMHMTLLGALLILAPRDVFAEICGRAADLGGQQLGGLLMLGIGTPVYLIAGLWLVGRDLRSTDPAPQT